MIVDTPHLDTFATENRAATRALLKSAGLVIYVFSPERYLEERAWSVIREERRFSAAIGVLNKANQVSPEHAQRIAAEIRQRFAELGSPEIRVLQLCATRHAPDHRGRLHSLPDGVVDEFMTLRAYIEHELREGDVARMVRQQRSRVVDHLEEMVDRVAPRDLLDRLESIEQEAREWAAQAGERLAEPLETLRAGLAGGGAPAAAGAPVSTPAEFAAPAGGELPQGDEAAQAEGVDLRPHRGSPR